MKSLIFVKIQIHDITRGTLIVHLFDHVYNEYVFRSFLRGICIS